MFVELINYVFYTHQVVVIQTMSQTLHLFRIVLYLFIFIHVVHGV